MRAAQTSSPSARKMASAARPSSLRSTAPNRLWLLTNSARPRRRAGALGPAAASAARPRVDLPISRPASPAVHAELARERERFHRETALQRPRHRRPHVVVLSMHLGERGGRTASDPDRVLRVGGELEVVGEVARAHGVRVGARGEPLGGVLADRLEQRQPAAACRSRGSCRRAPRAPAAARRSPPRRRRASQPPANAPSAVNASRSARVEQLEAPVERRAQRPLALGRVARAAVEHGERVAEARRPAAPASSTPSRAAASSIASGSPPTGVADLRRPPSVGDERRVARPRRGRRTARPRSSRGQRRDRVAAARRGGPAAGGSWRARSAPAGARAGRRAAARRRGGARGCRATSSSGPRAERAVQRLGVRLAGDAGDPQRVADHGAGSARRRRSAPARRSGRRPRARPRSPAASCRRRPARSASAAARAPARASTARTSSSRPNVGVGGAGRDVRALRARRARDRA